MAITCTPLETLQERFPNFNKYFKDICIKPFTYGLLLEKLHLFNQAKTPKEQSLLMIIEDYRASIPNRLELLQSLVDEMRKIHGLRPSKNLNCKFINWPVVLVFMDMNKSVSYAKNSMSGSV